MPLPNLKMDALRTQEAILRLGGLARAAERIRRTWVKPVRSRTRQWPVNPVRAGGSSR